LDRVAVDDVVAGLPVREFRWYKGRRHYSGWYWSSTMAGLVAYESRLELARILLADFDSGVTAIAAQPFQLTGPDGSSVRRHVPDLLLVAGGGKVTVVAVKAASRLADPLVQAQFSWARELAAYCTCCGLAGCRRTWPRCAALPGLGKTTAANSFARAFDRPIQPRSVSRTRQPDHRTTG